MTSYRGTPTLGVRVTSADGKELGTVQAVVGTCFRVLPEEQPDFWLGADTITKTWGAGVLVNISEDEIGRKSGPHGHHGYHHHN